MSAFLSSFTLLASDRLLQNEQTAGCVGREAEAGVHQLYTIGHSNLDWPGFLCALQHFEVGLLVDVRSRPLSSQFPHFSRPEIECALRDAGIPYLFLGEELGGRPEDRKLYRSDGLVDYRACRRSRGFQSGIERVLRGLEEGSSLALMCAEEDPLDCHRFLMITPELILRGVAPAHIRRSGVLESQGEAEDRLLEQQQLSSVLRPSLFPVDRAQVLEDAYLARAEKCAFRLDPQAAEIW